MSATSPRTDEMLGRTLLGRYRIVMPIGQGGMGTVYLARTEGAAGFSKPVVIKQILPGLVADGGMVQLFIREARILSNLHHPGIVNVLDFGEEAGAYVMVLEYVHGYNLAEWAKYVLTTRGHIPVDYLVHILIRVLETLHYAHTYKRSDGKSLAIIHRDVSPGNVLLDTDGHVKLADFGIARAADDPGEYRSRVGSFKGKLAYSAPELVAGEEATPRSDVYASGVVLLHLLLGRNPYKGQTMAESVQRVLNLTPPRASDERSDVGPEVDEVLERALRKSPKQRYPDAVGFAEALRTLRTRPEEEVATALAEQLRSDFEGEMPRLLDLEPLTERDSAWRGLQEDLEAKLRSTLPPPARAPTKPRQVPPETLAEATLRESMPEIEATRPPLPAKSSRVWWLVGGIGALVIAGAAVGAGLLLLQKPEGTAPQFVIVERRSADDGVPNAPTTPVAAPGSPAPPPTASVAASTPAEPPGGTPPTPAAAPAGATPAGGQTDGAALSRAVSAQSGRIQSCFASHVEGLGGTPQVSLHFRIDTQGNVTSASVSPAALAATPLGACLTGVARSTKFPPQGKPVSFSIPITARVSR